MKLFRRTERKWRRETAARRPGGMNEPDWRPAAFAAAAASPVDAMETSKCSRGFNGRRLELRSPLRQHLQFAPASDPLTHAGLRLPVTPGRVCRPACSCEVCPSRAYLLLTLSSIDSPPSVPPSASLPGASPAASDPGPGHRPLHPAAAVLLQRLHPPAAPQQAVHPPHHHIWWVALISTRGPFFPCVLKLIGGFSVFACLREPSLVFKALTFFSSFFSLESHKNAAGLFISSRTQLADEVQSLFLAQLRSINDSRRACGGLSCCGRGCGCRCHVLYRLLHIVCVPGHVWRHAVTAHACLTRVNDTFKGTVRP